MAEVTLPFQNSLWYYRQADYDTCPDMDSTSLPVSCEWRVARPGFGSDKHVANFSADSPLSCTLWEQTNDYVLHLEYVPQCDDSLISDVLNRTSEGRLKPLAFILGTNKRITPKADKTYYEMCGCKPKTITISASTNNKYVVAIDFSVKSLLTDGDATFITDSITDLAAEAPTALSGNYLGFNVAGQIRDENGNSLAHIVDSFEVTFNHNLDDRGDHDSLEKQYCNEGRYNCEGSFDMSMDEGGGSHWSDVLNQNEFDIFVDLGASGCPRLQLKNAKWKTHEFSAEVEDSNMMESCPFTAKLDDNGESVVTDRP